QEDYYSLQAVFAGVDRAERMFDPDPRVHAQRQAMLRRRRALGKEDTAEVASLLRPAVQAESADPVHTLGPATVAWVVLSPVSSLSSNGTSLAVQPDGSLLAGGVRPERDTYVVRAETSLKGITAIRLEVLTDESLPHHGPGRQDNGNLHLSEFKLLATPTRGSLDTTPLNSSPPNGSTLIRVKPVPLQNPTADFDQEGWTVAHAIDGQEKTAWGIYPQVGKPHWAVFELKEDLGDNGGTTLTIILEQNHGGGHLIGRARLSVTTAPRP